MVAHLWSKVDWEIPASNHRCKFSTFVIDRPNPRNRFCPSARLLSSNILILQITIVVLGFIQVRTGFAAYHAPGHISYGVIIAWAVVLAVWSAIYVAGLALIPRQQRERVERRRMEKGEKRESMEGMVQRDVGRV